jgi:hypothetical protein
MHPDRESEGWTVSIAHWDTLPDGNIQCWPLAGCETAAMKNGMMALVRFEYLTDPSSDAERKALQFAITVNEVSKLVLEFQALESQLQTNLAADVHSGKVS